MAGTMVRKQCVPLGTREGEGMSPTYRQASIYPSYTSHFETPNGVSVWLATDI
ncbi:MAG: hypothetical protein IKX24_08525 [Prevotella sp.]|nr:hypothetical protein [Prevotella sp.]